MPKVIPKTRYQRSYKFTRHAVERYAERFPDRRHTMEWAFVRADPLNRKKSIRMSDICGRTPHDPHSIYLVFEDVCFAGFWLEGKFIVTTCFLNPWSKRAEIEALRSIGL